MKRKEEMVKQRKPSKRFRRDISDIDDFESLENKHKKKAKPEDTTEDDLEINPLT